MASTLQYVRGDLIPFGINFISEGDVTGVTLTFIQPNGSVYTVVSDPVEDPVDVYYYEWTVPVDAAYGTWEARWTGTQDGSTLSASEVFDVIEHSRVGRQYQVEMQGLRRDTAISIHTLGRSVSLQRPGTYLRTPEGGQRLAGAPTPFPEAFRLVQSVTADARHYVTERGERMECDAVMIGLPGDDIRVDDEFSLSGQRYKVEWVHPDKRYEVRARCRLVG